MGLELTGGHINELPFISNNEKSRFHHRPRQFLFLVETVAFLIAFLNIFSFNQSTFAGVMWAYGGNRHH